MACRGTITTLMRTATAQQSLAWAIPDAITLALNRCKSPFPDSVQAVRQSA